MILDDDHFRRVEERIIEREATWEDFEALLAATKFFIEESTLQSDALRAILDEAGKNEILTKEFHIYKAMNIGAGVMKIKKLKGE